MDLGFRYQVRKSGEVSIEREGREVTVLRGAAATRFLERVETSDPQQVMARVTRQLQTQQQKTAPLARCKHAFLYTDLHAEHERACRSQHTSGTETPGVGARNNGR